MRDTRERVAKVPVIRQSIFVRFEPEISDGTLFLFDKASGNSFEGNADAWAVVSLLDGTNTVGRIADALGLENPELVWSFVADLAERGFVRLDHLESDTSTSDSDAETRR